MSDRTQTLALITGGSSGIGLALAHEFARRRYDLLLVSNQQQALEDARATLERSYGIRCHILYLDLTAADAAQCIYDHCRARELTVDVLVNNAGMLVFSEAVKVPADKVNAILQLHIHTPTLLCRHFGAEMAARRSGHILNVSSISSVMPYPGISLYGPTKTYLRYYSRALRSEMRLDSVYVTCLIPGATVTGLYDPERVNIELAVRLGVMLPADYVATRAVRALLRNKAECVPGLLNKLTMVVMPLIPRWAIDAIARHSSLLRRGHSALAQ